MPPSVERILWGASSWWAWSACPEGRPAGHNLPLADWIYCRLAAARSRTELPRHGLGLLLADLQPLSPDPMRITA
jgi:hypothetical protein